MVTIGVDAHKSLHVACALDDAGQQCSSWSGPNSPDGWDSFLAWLKTLPAPYQIGIEGAGNYGKGLAQFLVAHHYLVYDINPRWTAAGRRHARRQHKSDPDDARVVARFVRQEAPDLPVVNEDDVTAVLALLCGQRNDVVAEITRLCCRLHDLLLHFDPTYQRTFPGKLSTKANLARLRAFEAAPDASLLVRERAHAIVREAERLQLALSHETDLRLRIENLAQRFFAPLIALPGIGPLSAGALAGILGPGRRFRSDASLAAFAGVAPLQASSAGIVRHRINRGGNRALNAILYRMAITQARCYEPAKIYIARKRAEGRTKREAIRTLKRLLVREIFRAWNACAQQPATPPPSTA